MHGDIVRSLRKQALALVQMARKLTDRDLSAELEIMAIEILASASKLERANLPLPQQRSRG
jgi:hypothetical protein